eukprot:5073132-Amphidinium_carterae.1
MVTQTISSMFRVMADVMVGVSGVILVSNARICLTCPLCGGMERTILHLCFLDAVIGGLTLDDVDGGSCTESSTSQSSENDTDNRRLLGPNAAVIVGREPTVYPLLGLRAHVSRV